MHARHFIPTIPVHRTVRNAGWWFYMFRWLPFFSLSLFGTRGCPRFPVKHVCPELLSISVRVTRRPFPADARLFGSCSLPVCRLYSGRILSAQFPLARFELATIQTHMCPRDLGGSKNFASLRNADRLFLFCVLFLVHLIRRDLWLRAC